jgi:hypothetical protein
MAFRRLWHDMPGDVIGGRSSLVGRVCRRIGTAVGDGWRACARLMNHWPIRLIIVLAGIVLFDSTVGFVRTHLSMKVFFHDIKEANSFSTYGEYLLWFFRGYFVAIFAAKMLPRAIVVFPIDLVLLVLRCLSGVAYSRLLRTTLALSGVHAGDAGTHVGQFAHVLSV